MVLLWVYGIISVSAALGVVVWWRYPWKWVHNRYHPSPGYRETRVLASCDHCHKEWMTKLARGAYRY